MPHRRHDLVHFLHDFKMILHATVSKVPILSHCTKEHFLVCLHQFVSLGHDSNVHENETGFVCASIEHTDVLNVTLNWHTLWRQQIVVIIGNIIGLRIIYQLPIVKGITICVLE